MRREVHVSRTQQREAYDRTNGICIICGKKISPKESGWSVDHYIPRAVYKWAPNSNTKEIIESSDNIYVVHPQCNVYKGSKLPTNNSINNMHANKEIKKNVKDLYKGVEKSVDSYRSIKQSTLSSQEYRCAVCGKKITLNNSTMRRVDNNQGRNKENAMCLCEGCNIRAGSSKQKRKMTKNIEHKQTQQKNKRGKNHQSKNQWHDKNH